MHVAVKATVHSNLYVGFVLLSTLCSLGNAAGLPGTAAAAARSWAKSSSVDGLPQLLLSRLGHSDEPLHRQARRLMQQSKTRVPQCMWSDVREVCAPSQLVYLSLKAKPVTIFHRVAAEAYDRNLVCNGHPGESACNSDRANRCMFWNKSCIGMDAYELVNWVGGDGLDGDATAAGFTCSSTDAAVYRECKTAGDAGPKGLCRQLQACKFMELVDACLPASYESRTMKQLQADGDAFVALSTPSWGNCAGACYARQAAVCSKLTNSSSSCTSKPFCVRDTDPYDGKSKCMHRDTASKASDAYSKEYALLQASCFGAKTQLECETPQVVPVNIGAFRSAKDLQKLAASPLAACPV